MSKKIKMTVEMEVTPAQALTLQAMFEYWTNCGQAGRSRVVSFYVDGDGNFQPNCVIKIDGEVPELTDELRKAAITRDDNDNRAYDFDPLAWKLGHWLSKNTKVGDTVWTTKFINLPKGMRIGISPYLSAWTKGRLDEFLPSGMAKVWFGEGIGHLEVPLDNLTDDIRRER